MTAALGVRLNLAVLAIAVCGCAPLGPTAAVQRSTDNESTQTTRKVDCSRQFDSEDAGFQTCVERGDQPPSE